MSEGYSMVMPFVTTVSHGGPHEDAGYVAGWEMGALDARLTVAAAVGVDPGHGVFRRENLPQLDLICMKHDATWRERGWGESVDEQTTAEWAYVTMKWAGS